MNAPTFSLRFRFGFLLALAALILPALSARADETPAGTLAFSIPVPGSSLSTKEVHDIVIQVSTAREWIIKDDSTEHVVIYLNHRKNEATVTYLISDKLVQAYCEGYATDGNGNRKKPEQPSGWLSNLKKDITKRLGQSAGGVK